MFDWIGWLATAIFTTSYFCRRPHVLRRVQGVAALFWLGYGVLIHATPIIVANVIVAAVAFGSSLKTLPQSALAPEIPAGPL